MALTKKAEKSKREKKLKKNKQGMKNKTGPSHLSSIQRNECALWVSDSLFPFIHPAVYCSEVSASSLEEVKRIP